MKACRKYCWKRIDPELAPIQDPPASSGMRSWNYYFNYTHGHWLRQENQVFFSGFPSSAACVVKNGVNLAKGKVTAVEQWLSLRKGSLGSLPPKVLLFIKGLYCWLEKKIVKLGITHTEQFNEYLMTWEKEGQWSSITCQIGAHPRGERQLRGSGQGCSSCMKLENSLREGSVGGLSPKPSSGN